MPLPVEAAYLPSSSFNDLSRGSLWTGLTQPAAAIDEPFETGFHSLSGLAGSGAPLARSGAAISVARSPASIHEPIWAAMLCGFAFLGGMLRHRPATVTVA